MSNPATIRLKRQDQTRVRLRVLPRIPPSANSLSIGTVTEGTPAASITGEPPNQFLNLVLPGGDRYDIAFYDPARPAAAEVILRTVFAADSVTFPHDFDGSIARCLVAAASDAVWSIKQNGAEIATISFLTGSFEGVFAGIEAAFITGDELTVVAPNPRDATLSGVYGTLAGSRGEPEEP